MPKEKKKTKEIEYAIKYLYETKKLTPTQIALELGVAEAIVDSTINEQPESKPRKESKSQNLMVRQTAGKKTNNVSVMTEAASKLNDEMVKGFGNTQSRTSKNSIFRPNG